MTCGWSQPREVWRGKNPTLPGSLRFARFVFVFLQCLQGACLSRSLRLNLSACHTVTTSNLAHNWYFQGKRFGIFANRSLYLIRQSFFNDVVTVEKIKIGDALTSFYVKRDW